MFLRLKRVLSVILCLSVLLSIGDRLPISAAAAGHTYFVDAVNGNDANGDGSQGKPYQTIIKVFPLLTGGDTVLLASGSYPTIVAGRTWPENSTDKSWNCSPVDVFSDWVTFKAAPGQQPHIASIDLGTWNESPSHALPFSKVGNSNVYMRFDSLTIDDGVSIMGSRYVEIKNCTIHRQGDLVGSLAAINEKNGIKVINGQHITIENNDISHVAIGVMVMSTDFILRGNNIHDNSHDGMRIYGGTNLLIEGNEFHELDDGVDDSSGLDWNMHVDGIHIFFPTTGEKWGSELNRITFRGNLFYHIEAMGIMVNASNPPTTTYKNFVFENNVMGPTSGNLLHWGAAIEGFTFRHNTIVYTDATQWTSMYRTLSGAKYNVSWWPGGSGKMVYNNIFVDGKSSQPKPSDTSFAFVANNLYLNTPSYPLESGSALITALPYTAGDFTGTLLADSQAINAGTCVDVNGSLLPNLLTVDINGLPRDSSPDIGAYEVQGTSDASYSISATQSTGGTITLSSESVKSGGSVTIKVTPDEGYAVSDLLVNGVSVGIVTDYTIKGITKNTTITTIFTKKQSSNETTAWTNPYSDIKDGVWYYDAVKFISQKSFMNGSGASFQPESTLTRGMFVTILYRISGDSGSFSNPFSDIDSGDWYAQGAAWAAENGIARGIGDGRFGPTCKITREQLAAMLYNYANYKKLDVTTGVDISLASYNDVAAISPFASTALDWACGNAIIKGDANGSLNPQGPAIHIEAAAMLQRFCEKYTR